MLRFSTALVFTPRTYEWARKMAVDALEYDDSGEDANPAGALEEILENPERLRDLDLDAFAEELERQVCSRIYYISVLKFTTFKVQLIFAIRPTLCYNDVSFLLLRVTENKHITLYDIRAELNHRYKDLRSQYQSPTQDDIFYWLVKESKETFYAGLYWLLNLFEFCSS